MSAPVPTFKHFVLRAEARKLYRDLLRNLRGVDPAVANDVKQTARSMFAESAEEHDVEKIRTLLIDGRDQLGQMEGLFRTALRR
jgi:hypothetical protein